jgi:hypothetical protein
LPGTSSIENPSRRGRSDPDPRVISRPDRSTPIGPNHTVPYGTVPLLNTSQAINCLATIISPSGTKTLKSLRDNKPSIPVHILDSVSALFSRTTTRTRTMKRGAALGWALGQLYRFVRGRDLGRKKRQANRTQKNGRGQNSGGTGQFQLGVLLN